MRCRSVVSPLFLRPFTLPSFVLGGGLLLTATFVQAEGELGSLFFSPSQRQSIERARVGEDAAQVAPPEVASVSGWVKRSSGKGTVWINGEPWSQGQRGFLSQPPVIADRAVQIAGQTVQLGQTLDLATGQRTDVVLPGTVSVKSPGVAARDGHRGR